MINKSAGFTLLELLVVIAIIGLLSAVVFGSLSDSKVKAKEVVALKDVRKLNEAIFMYELDTSTKLECANGEDCTYKLTSNPGVAGWDGPYFGTTTHPWGGQIVVSRYATFAIPPVGSETLISFTNDRPGFGMSDNQVGMPVESMLRIDEALDDGDLTTGYIRGLQTANRAEVNNMLIKPSI